MQDPGTSQADGRSVAAGLEAVSAGLEAIEVDVGVVEEAVEDSDGVGAPAHAGADRIREATLLGENLLASLLADDLVEPTDHGWVRMRTCDCAEQIMRVLHAGHPVPERLVDGVLQCLGTVLDRDDLRTEQPHACDVERLTPGVLSAHVDHALHAHQGSGRGRGDAVLTGTGLCDQPGLAHASGEQRLAEHVVDLV